MTIIRRMAREGLAVIPVITHKLPEVMAISDRVTVLRLSIRKSTLLPTIFLAKSVGEELV